MKSKVKVKMRKLFTAHWGNAGGNDTVSISGWRGGVRALPSVVAVGVLCAKMAGATSSEG